MSRIPFNKVSLQPTELLEKLKSRGLLVSDERDALAYLQYVGGYRLKGYYFHVTDPVTKRFPDGYRFEQIAERYELDRQLRYHCFAAITRLETAIRAVIANHLSTAHGPHWFLQHDLFNHSSEWSLGKLVGKIEAEVDRSKKTTFISHYRTKFSEPYLAPSWAVAECVTFGMWSKTYNALKSEGDKKAISVRFKVNQPHVFTSWLHSLTVLRNTVAHHGRLLGHRFVAGPQNCRERNLFFDDPHTLYSVATVMNYLQTVTRLPNSWKADLEKTLQDFPGVDQAEVGFPISWKDQPGWATS